MEARFVHEEYDGLLSRHGANHAPGEVLSGFRHVYAEIGDETAKPGLHRVGDSQERQAARDGVDGIGWLTGGSSFAALFSPQGWSAFARESTFSYTPSEKCKAVSIKGEGIRWLLFTLDFVWRAWLQLSGFPFSRE